MAEKRIPTVDYCKEAMEMYVKKIPTVEFNNIVYNLALLVNGKINELDIVWNKVDEKTKEATKVKVPAKSFLRCDTIKNALTDIGISKSQISKYTN